jgi:microcystin-dependent protein
MPLDFPTNPVNGQVYQGFVYDSVVGSWESTSTLTSLGARLSAIESRVPTGTLHQWTTATAPQGYLLCQGQAISRTLFVNLFTAIGTLYGAGDGSTTFNIPDLRGNVPVGKSSSGTFSTLNNKGGAETVTLSLTQIPSHTHIQNEHNHTQNEHNHSQNAHNHIFSENALLVSNTIGFAQTSAINGNGFDISPNSSGFTTATNNATTATNQATTATNQNAGGGLAHNNLQPYIVLNYIIKT